MKFSDIFRMCMDSLKRRKGRTVLTVLGVFIGCASIIIMVSIGAGMKESTDMMIKNMGDVSVIEVYGGNSSNAKLNETAVSDFKAIEGVKAVFGKSSIDASCSCATGVNDRYFSDWANVVGVDPSAMEEMGYELVSGHYPQAEDEIIVGEFFAYNFRDTLMPPGRDYRQQQIWNDDWTEIIGSEEPFFDPLNMTVKMTFTSYYWGDDFGSSSDPKSYEQEFKIVGVMKENYNVGWETSSGVFANIAVASKVAEALGQTVDQKTGLSFTEINVKADNIKNVSTIEQSIKDMGYYTYSMQSMIEELEKQTRQTELMLGGIGAISLLVAAIGITNTMTMSITERTKEIGIMKALGCYIKDIRLMFLIEAGLIGLMGGILGLLFSYLASIIINLISFNAFATGITFQTILYALFGHPDMSRTSVITPLLVIFGIVFSCAVGVISGYSPANKAVKISALEAIRKE